MAVVGNTFPMALPPSPAHRPTDVAAEPERPKRRLDRELIELLHEIRVLLPGAEVVFGFLLPAPFAARFEDVTRLERSAYCTAFAANAVAIILLVTPAAFHRIRFRQRDKEFLLRLANRLMVLALLLMAVSLTSVVLLVTSYLYSETVAYVTAVLIGMTSIGLWLGLGVFRSGQDGAEEDEEDDRNGHG